MGKWTQGPWKIDKELTAHTGEWLISLDRGAHRGMCIAETRPGTGNESANARLIAAAPELAEALEALIDAADTSDDCQYGTLATSFVRNICIAALAKAGAA